MKISQLVHFYVGDSQMIFLFLIFSDPFLFLAAWTFGLSLVPCDCAGRCYGPANQPGANRVTRLVSDQQASSTLVGNF